MRFGNFMTAVKPETFVIFMVFYRVTKGGILTMTLDDLRQCLEHPLPRRDNINLLFIVFLPDQFPRPRYT